MARQPLQLPSAEWVPYPDFSIKTIARQKLASPRAKIWDASGQDLQDVCGPSDSATVATLSSDGRWLATAANEDGIVQIYALDIRDLLEVARKRVTRNLTAEECKRYLQSKVCPPLQ